MTHSNILIFIHGMTKSPSPRNHKNQYQNFFSRLCQEHPELKQAFSDQIYVEWGHELVNQKNVRPDQKIMRGENTVHSLVSYDKIKCTNHPNSKIIHDFSILRTLASIINFPIRKKMEEIFIFGLGDVVYYCSEDGEDAIREAIYGQVLDKLRKYRKDDVRLHIIAHSLGCTVAYDFLYGLFAPSKNWTKRKPDFASNVKYGAKFMEWRKKQQTGKLKLGSMTSMGSSLPILLLRKQNVVDMLFQEKKLDARVIGMKKEGIIWKIFYDVDDMLSYPTRNLFEPNDAIMDIQVDTADLPHTAHTKYWTNKKVIKEAASLLATNV